MKFFESIGISKSEIPEQIKTFEELENTRDLKLVKYDQLEKFLQEHEQYWRLPTVEEVTSLMNKNKKDFFKYKTYWAEESDSTYRYRLVHLGGVFDKEPLVDYGDINENLEAGLVLFKK